MDTWTVSVVWKNSDPSTITVIGREAMNTYVRDILDFSHVIVSFTVMSKPS